eukprot:COSAG06_NODE_651_length_13384_cov_2.712382_8_plen_576_part_00
MQTSEKERRIRFQIIYAHMGALRQRTARAVRLGEHVGAPGYHRCAAWGRWQCSAPRHSLAVGSSTVGCDCTTVLARDVLAAARSVQGFQTVQVAAEDMEASADAAEAQGQRLGRLKVAAADGQRLESQPAGVDAQATKTESQPAEVDVQATKAESQPAEMDAQATKTAQTRALLLLSAGIFGVLSIWYVGSAVLPLMRADTTLRPDGLSNAEGSLLTSITNIGFVVGCLGSALVNLSDLVRPSVLVLVGAVAAAGITAGSCLEGVSFELLLASRCLVGVCIALVYPPSMKLLATWYEPEKRGAAIGILFSFFCIGSAFPQLLKALAGESALGSWRFPLLVTSAVTASAGILVFVGVGEGPFPFPPAPKLQPSQMMQVLRRPSVLLPILGYTGHQIEVMNMWGWIGEFLVQVHGLSERNAGMLAFAAISMGGPGSWLGGRLGDKYGRAKICSISLIVSGSCCLCVGLISDLPFGLTVLTVIVWGLSILVDSPNFPAIISKNAEQEYVGTALSMQLASGYLMCSIAMYVMAILGDIIGWRWTYPVMSSTPLMGLVAMQLLQRLEDHEAEVQKDTMKP